MTTTSTTLKLDPNSPVLISLASSEPNIIWDGTTPVQVHYRLQDGRSLYLPIEMGASIVQLGLREKEAFYVCRYSSPDRKVKDRINVWLSPQGEKIRAEEEKRRMEEEEESKLERQLARSIHQAQAKKEPAQATSPAGPVAMPKPAEIPAALGPLYSRLLADTTQLLSVYSEATKHAESLGIPSGVVRSVMLSAYISLNQRGSGRAA
jgi:hypothetical protein